MQDNPKEWIDQPDMIKNAKTLLRTNFETRIVEVRYNGKKFFVTIGNLFGSQTLATESIEVMFQLLNVAVKGKKTEIPEGAEFIKA